MSEYPKLLTSYHPCHDTTYCGCCYESSGEFGYIESVSSEEDAIEKIKDFKSQCSYSNHRDCKCYFQLIDFEDMKKPDFSMSVCDDDFIGNDLPDNICRELDILTKQEIAERERREREAAEKARKKQEEWQRQNELAELARLKDKYELKGD